MYLKAERLVRQAYVTKQVIIARESKRDGISLNSEAITVRTC